MEKKIRSTKGITLVALIVTVILLLILAGISIASLTGSDLFEKVQEAKQKSENAQIKEDIILADYENKIDEYVDGSRNTINISKEEYEKLLRKGTWELLATCNSTTEQQVTVEDLNQFQSIGVIVKAETSVFATSTIPYEILKNGMEVHTLANNGNVRRAIVKYINDTTVSLKCFLSSSSLSMSFDLYGIY